MSGVRRRTRARELALQFLYMLEQRGPEAQEELVPFVEHHTKGAKDSRGRKEVREFALAIANGVSEHQQQIDGWIEAIARNWRLDRMAHIDRNVLRIAVWELIFREDIPYKVVINEAIDIAKRFSTAQSGAFVNGILDRARVLIHEKRAEGNALPEPPDHSVALTPEEEGRGGAPGLPSTGATVIGHELPPAPVPRPRARPTE